MTVKGCAMETRGTLLMVEETPEVAELLRGVLTKAGYRVLVAQTAELGLHILAAFLVGAVLTDAIPPVDNDGGDRWAALDRLARAAGRAALVLYTDEPERYAAYADHGFAARLAKPLDLDALVATVGALLPAGPRPSTPRGPAAVGEG